jgi:hypothetical protein
MLPGKFQVRAWAKFGASGQRLGDSQHDARKFQEGGKGMCRCIPLLGRPLGGGRALFDVGQDLLTEPGEHREVSQVFIVVFPDQLGGQGKHSRFEILVGQGPRREVVLGDPVVAEFVPAFAHGLVDSEVDFGSMRMGPGLAYTEETDPLEGARIIKSWESIEGRQFLIEAVPYLEAEGFLEDLDLTSSIQPPGRWVPGRSGLVGLLARRGKQPDAGHFIARAELGAGRPGFMLDYSVLNSTLTNMVFRGDQTYYCSGLTVLYQTSRIEGGTVVKYANTNSAELRFVGPVLFETSAYRPAIFTAQDDNTVGQIINGSSGNPTNTYAVSALQFWSVPAPLTIEHIRVAYAYHGLILYVPSGHVLRHAQFVRCTRGIWCSGTAVTTQNVLFHETLTPFIIRNEATATGENLTLHQATRVVDASNALSLTNSLLVSVTNWTYSFYGASNATNSSGSAFQTIGAGNHYLANGSPYRNAGTTNLSAGLLTQLRQRTTHPPILLGNVSVNTVLSPQAPRDTGPPDLGYHYEPIDYIASNVLVSATLTLTNGVALGASGSYGLRIQSGGRVASEGLPHVLNRVVSLANVQEQPIATGGATFIDLPSGLYPIMEFRFTDLSVRQGAQGTILANATINPFQLFSFQHGQLRGAILSCYPSTSSIVTATLLNNLVERTTLSFGHSYYSQNTLFYVSLYNNLFRNGSLHLTYDTGTYNPSWYVRDNLFDGTSQSPSGNAWNTYILRGYNGFISGTSNSLGGSNNVTGLTADYQIGPLGPFYYPTGGGASSLTNLIKGGSRTAPNAGLYHFTVLTDQTKAGTNTLSIGYHYVATGPGTNGLVGCWALDEGAGSTASDSSGFGHHGTLINSPTWAPGYWGSALTFSVDRYVTVPSHAQHSFPTNDFTIAAWVNPVTSGSVVAKGTGSSASGTEYILHVNSQGFYFRGAWRTSAALSVPTGVWSHVAVTYSHSNQTLRFYRNGALITTTVISGSYATDLTRALHIGRQGSSVQNNLNGTADDIRIYRRALSSGEIAALHHMMPVDTDGDGLPDYFEDRNGNGIFNTGETDWQTSNTGMSGDGTLQVFTPLK